MTEHAPESSWDREVQQLDDLNDAIAAWAAHHGQLERWRRDEADERLDDATHAAFDIITGRSDE